MDQEKFEGYDVIGDVHGCARTLMKLLEAMGYRKRAGVYTHLKRQAIFVGDIVDRGPHIRQTMEVVYNMVDAGHAQMVISNHEYSVYCYATEDLRFQNTGQTRYLREHNARNNSQVEQTFEQFANHPHDLREYLQWISELPLFLEMPNFRVVHACWDDPLIRAYRQKHGHNRLSPKIIVDSTDHSSLESRAINRLTRGIMLPLPENHVMLSRDGFKRRHFRTKFWTSNPQTYGDIVFQPDPLPEHLIDRPLNEGEKAQLLQYPKHEKLVFFGHYWLQGEPKVIKPNICCLDYSAVRFGRLAAYRIDEEKSVNPENYLWLYVDPAEQKS